MPFADDRSLVAGRAEQLGKRDLAAVEFTARVVVEAVLVAVLAGEDTGPAWTTQRVGHVAAIEPHSFRRDPIDIRRLIELAAISAHSLVAVIITHDEQDVRALGRQTWMTRT